MSTSQKQITVYSQAADGYLISQNTTYLTARSGSNLTAITTGLAGGCGQNKVSTAHYCYLPYVMFDCSEIPANVISIDDVQPYVAVGKYFTQAATLQLREASWTPPLTTAAWIAGADMSSHTLLASLASASISDYAYDEWTDAAGIEDWIVPGGICYGVLCSDRFVNGDTPASAEYGDVFLGDGDALRMKLVVTYTSEDTPVVTSRSLVVRPWKNRAEGGETVARQYESIIDWSVEENVAYAEVRPTSTADIPRSRWYVIGKDTPGVSVKVATRAEDTPDIISIVYRAYGVVGVRDGAWQRAVWPAERTSPYQRVTPIVSEQYMSAGEALEYIVNLYNRSAATVLKATINVTGGLYTVDHLWQPAPLILHGDWIDLQSEHGHAPVKITASSYDPDTHSVTITTGQQELREPIIPGQSALPERPSVYGSASVYETYSDSSYSDESGGKVEYDEEGMTTKTGSGTISGDSSAFGRNVPYPPPPGYVPEPDPTTPWNLPQDMP